MNKIKEWLNSPKFQRNIKPEIIRTFAVIFFTIIYGIGVTWFLEASVIPMYTGGIPGIAQLLRDFMKFTLGLDTSGWEGLFLGSFIIISNIPIMLLGWFGVSKKFVIYSMISVIIQATMLGFIPSLDLGLSSESQALTATILGGILIGVGVGGALKYGTSTGGLDIVAQYLSLKKGKSVGFISMVLNIVTAFLGGLITAPDLISRGVLPGVTQAMAAAGIVISYTILRLIITTIVTDKLHTAYQFTMVEIITNDPREIVSDIISKIYRGVTLINVQGGYSKQDKTLIKVIISSYEFTTLHQLINRLDSKAFIIVTPVKNVFGNFKKRTIA
ncbi:YitT family protein [Acholeplasma granularum]|uniref:YitT family protein n=1 Tax=Acholeplasma granularum TaxID=264635 RepID=UPI0004726416|nr:YitT family protein [Acholeplasma granularum]